MKKKLVGKKTFSNFLIDAICWSVVGIAALLSILPFIHIMAKSISADAFVVANKIFLLPKGIQFEAYERIFRDSSIMRSMLVTIFVTVVFTVLGLFLTVCASYALTRKEMKGNGFITLLIMLTYYFAAGTIPDYLLMSNLGLLDTIWCLILPLAFSPYNFLIMKNNFQTGIPDSLIEAARLDGASHFTILSRIVVPLSKPILATISLFLAVGRWNSYSDALYYIKQNTGLRPLQLKLYYLIVEASESVQGEGMVVQAISNPEVMQAACIMFAAIPIICVYPFIQKYFVTGTMVGAVKG